MNPPGATTNRTTAPSQLGGRLGGNQSAYCYGKEQGGNARLHGAFRPFPPHCRTTEWADAYRGVGDPPTQSFGPTNSFLECHQ